jgi:hypothetical protein
MQRFSGTVGSLICCIAPFYIILELFDAMFKGFRCGKKLRRSEVYFKGGAFSGVTSGG